MSGNNNVKTIKTEFGEILIYEGETCPFCGKKTLTLRETETEVPYFGKVYLYSMECSSCNFRKNDVEIVERKQPKKQTFVLESEEDLKVRVVKSSEATVKIHYVGEITPGPASNGYITNIEGLIRRMLKQIEFAYESEEDPDVKKKAKKLIKKLKKALMGYEKLKITIEDPSGNSAIISEKVISK